MCVIMCGYGQHKLSHLNCTVNLYQCYSPLTAHLFPNKVRSFIEYQLLPLLRTKLRLNTGTWLLQQIHLLAVAACVIIKKVEPFIICSLPAGWWLYSVWRWLPAWSSSPFLQKTILCNFVGTTSDRCPQRAPPVRLRCPINRYRHKNEPSRQILTIWHLTHAVAMRIPRTYR